RAQAPVRDGQGGRRCGTRTKPFGKTRQQVSAVRPAVPLGLRPVGGATVDAALLCNARRLIFVGAWPPLTAAPPVDAGCVVDGFGRLAATLKKAKADSGIPARRLVPDCPDVQA